MAIIKTLKESKIVSKDRPRQTIYPVTSSDAVIVPNKGKLTTVLSKVAFSNNYNDLDNLPANISTFNNDVGYLTSFTETDPTVPLWAKQNTKPSYNYSEILNTPILATVATSGNYNDLINKPTIPIVPTNVSAFNNDAGYLTTESDPTVPNHVKGITQQNITNWNNKADVFTINCVYDGTSITSCDKTFAEISSAYNSGKILNVVINNGYAFGRLNQVASNAFYFNVVDTQDFHWITSYELEISSNDTCNITLASINLANYYTKSEVNSALDDKQDTIADLATIRSGAALGATAYQKPNGGIPKSDLASNVQTSLGKADTALQQHQDLSSLADGAEYDSSAKKIYLKHGNTRLSNPIDATAFIKDGMIDTVTVTNGNLVISFNTDAGKQPISLPISSIFNANNYYTKTEIDNKGYLTSETDPIYSASVAASITSANIDNWNNKQNKIAPPEVGSLYRSDVSGSGSISIRGTKGTFPHVNYAGTYILITSMQSSTQSYGLSVNFGGNTYTLNTTNGLIEDTRQVTVNAVATWSGSVVGNVAANTIISVKILSTLDEITTVGMTAVTNSYNDLDNKPTIPTVYNGKLTIQKNGTQVATFTANQSGNATANIIVPTKVSELNNDSGFITGYTETDPVFTASVAAGITSSDISNWNSKTSNIGTITGITMNGVSKGTSGVVNLGTVVTSETDPTVPAWAKAANKPTYTASEVGALPSTTQIPSKTSDLTNDSGFITGYTETDPVFTASVAHGITSSDIANWNSKTSNVGTITGITMNGASKGTSGVVDLGTVITEHQDISGKVDKETGKGLSSNDYTDAEKTKLSGIATGAEVNVQSDWNQTTTTADDYIKNKPSLATVATSGSYSDLSNKPKIPTVNNATLTIQKNGTNVATFTANASTGATANITVPVATSDLTNDSGFLGDTDVSYDANTKTLIIGSVNTYTITFNTTSVSAGFSVQINGGEFIMNQSPISVNEGDSILVRLMAEDRPTATMGGESIAVYSEGPETFYFTIESVTGDIVVSV